METTSVSLPNGGLNPLDSRVSFMALSVTECRAILGAEADGKTDEQIERLRDSLEALANGLYDQLQEDWKADREAVRWAAYSQQSGEQS